MITIDGVEYEGSVSVQETIEASKNLSIRSISGMIEVKSEDNLWKAAKIECARFVLGGVKIGSRNLGSEDDRIVYGFTAETVTVKPEGYITQ